MNYEGRSLGLVGRVEELRVGLPVGLRWRLRGGE